MYKGLVVLTGASGFIGSALHSLLHRRSRNVRAVTRQDKALSQTVAVGDIGHATDWSIALQRADIVVHLAARVHILSDEAADPLKKFRAVNVEGTLNLARQAAEAGVRRFIYLSSIKVNGAQTLPEQPFTEQSVPAPLDPYGISKYEAEKGLIKLAKKTGMEVVIIRPPLVYGPGVKGNFFTMMYWLHKGIPLPFGAIHNNRSLVALDNLVDLIVTCIDHPTAANQVFLAGDGEDFSTPELLLRLGKALNRPARLIPVPAGLLEAGAIILGKRDIARRLCGSLQVDISKVRTMLGWNPPVSVDEALQKTVESYLHSQDHYK